MSKYIVNLVVTVDADSEESAINLIEDACNSYRGADIEIVGSEAEEE